MPEPRFLGDPEEDELKAVRENLEDQRKRNQAKALLLQTSGYQLDPLSIILAQVDALTAVLAEDELTQTRIELGFELNIAEALRRADEQAQQARNQVLRQK